MVAAMKDMKKTKIEIKFINWPEAVWERENERERKKNQK